jgi:cell shape-determining protein MreC
VIPVVCILLVGAIGWIRSADFKESLTAVNTHLQNLYARQDTHRAELQTLILTQFDQTRSQIRAQEERLNTQEKELLEALRSNRETTGEKLEEQNQQLRSQTDEMRKHHAIMIFNQSHAPDQHLSLDLPIPPEKRH